MTFLCIYNCLQGSCQLIGPPLTTDRLMKPGSNGNIGAQRGHSRTPSSSLYGHPESQGSHEPSARITRSMSRLARSDGLIIPGPFTELTLPLLPPANNPQVCCQFLKDYTVLNSPMPRRTGQFAYLPPGTESNKYSLSLAGLKGMASPQIS